jgi:zinc transporter ZupT
MFYYDVLFFGLITALFTGIGVIPMVGYHLIKHHQSTILGIGQILAAVFMTMASVSLIREGANDAMGVSVGITIGVIFILCLNWLTQNLPDLDHVIQAQNLDGARQGVLIIFLMTIHSMAEGVGIGVSFGGGQTTGQLISIMIAFHNIPEGLAIAAITVPNGMSVWRSALWAIFSSLPQPILGVVSYGFVVIFEPFLEMGYGIAAGAMLWMVLFELMPEAVKRMKSEGM